MISQTNFLFKRKSDGAVVYGVTTLEFENIDEYKSASDAVKFAMLLTQGHDVVRLIKPGENLIGVDFGK